MGEYFEALEYYEKDEFTDIGWMLKNAYRHREEENEVFDWIKNNPIDYIKMAQAVNKGDGYTVEEEKKYKVKDKDGRLILVKDKNGVIGYANNRIIGLSDTQRLTEQEIKDYDERFWPFADEVTE